MSLIWLPLRAAGREIGALVGRGPRRARLAHEETEAATLFAQHAAALVDAAQALQREQRAAVTDPLTGLLNRRGFQERFREELQRAERAGRPLSVVLVDCDDLKVINDRGGHALGDRVLERLAHVLRAEKRLEDVAARIGGDEFALLLPELDAEQASPLVERLSRRLGDRELEPGGATSAELLRAADRAMYAAKNARRARAVPV
jgi:GGDEF domain-containing protein